MNKVFLSSCDLELSHQMTSHIYNTVTVVFIIKAMSGEGNDFENVLNIFPNAYVRPSRGGGILPPPSTKNGKSCQLYSSSTLPAKNCNITTTRYELLHMD